MSIFSGTKNSTQIRPPIFGGLCFVLAFSACAAATRPARTASRRDRTEVAAANVSARATPSPAASTAASPSTLPANGPAVWIKGAIALPPLLTQAYVRAGIDAHLAEVQRCAEQGALWNGEGRVVLGVGFEGEGFVSSIEPPGDASGDAEACLREALAHVPLLATTGTLYGATGASVIFTLGARSAPFVTIPGPTTMNVAAQRVLVTVSARTSTRSTGTDLRRGIVLPPFIAALEAAIACRTAALERAHGGATQSGWVVQVNGEGAVDVLGFMSAPAGAQQPPDDEVFTRCVLPAFEQIRLPRPRAAFTFMLRAVFEPLGTP